MMKSLADLVRQTEFTREEIAFLLGRRETNEVELLRQAAEALCFAWVGNTVHFRGLVEFSNICVCDCHYCGIRKSNPAITRFFLTLDEVMQAAHWCAEQGYGSLVLQSGERRDEAFIDFVETAVRRIRAETRTAQQPDGLGITLCVGEQTRETYARFKAAGAHRYLLRIESTSPHLFRQLHPAGQSFEQRVQCLQWLRETGFQVGTGVMIGFPGQTLENLADDVLFFRSLDVDMIGMGPYLVHKQTPMAAQEKEMAARHGEVYQLALNMIAVTRLVLKNVNIAATTALQAMKATGREEGLTYGANVIMPQLTPTEFRKDYQLYEGKPCLDENRDQCKMCLQRRITGAGRVIGFHEWGDSRHARDRTENTAPSGEGGSPSKP
ncbi:MAG: [FeFe] hydrogenase H-cluster radical SAM maturase HydE [bacterium]